LFSVAVPGSVASQASRELRTFVCGQIARACSTFCIDEVIVYNDEGESRGVYLVHYYCHHNLFYLFYFILVDKSTGTSSKIDSSAFLARNLQYSETPIYLRRALIPQHADLSCASMNPSLEAPHHVKMHERCTFREGIIMKKPPGNRPNNGGTGSFVEVGLKLPCLIDRVLPADTRVTVRIQSYDKNGRKFLLGKAVSPMVPREEEGTYWGYATRYASSFNEIFSNNSFGGGGYDYKIGVSEKSKLSVESRKFKIPPFQHLLIVFGGEDGIEDVVENDDQLNMNGSDAFKLFNAYLNTSPTPSGCRSIRTEESLFISLSRLSPIIEQAQSTQSTN
jgi:methyltransferase